MKNSNRQWTRMNANERKLGSQPAAAGRNRTRMMAKMSGLGSLGPNKIHSGSPGNGSKNRLCSLIPLIPLISKVTGSDRGRHFLPRRLYRFVSDNIGCAARAVRSDRDAKFKPNQGKSSQIKGVWVWGQLKFKMQNAKFRNAETERLGAAWLAATIARVALASV